MAPFSLSSAGLAIITLFTITTQLVAGQQQPYVSSREQLDEWMRTTRADLTFVGDGPNEPINPLGIRLVYCSRRRRNSDVCGGDCIVYTGPGNQCVKTTFTAACVAATSNVIFCASETCEQPCNLYSSCGVRLDSGFCSTPNTNSIQIPFVRDSSPNQPQPSESPSSTASSSSSTQINATLPPPSDIPPVVTNAPTAGATDGPAVSQVAESKDSNLLPVGAIVGIIFAVLFMVGGTIFFLLYLRRKTRRHSMRMRVTHAPPPMSYPPTTSAFATTGHSAYRESPPSPVSDYFDNDMRSMYTGSSMVYQPTVHGTPQTVTASSMSYASNPSRMSPPPRRPVHGQALSQMGTNESKPITRPLGASDSKPPKGQDMIGTVLRWGGEPTGQYTVHSDSGIRIAPNGQEYPPHYSHA